jgi:hypothetical protein
MMNSIHQSSFFSVSRDYSYDNDVAYAYVAVAEREHGPVADHGALHGAISHVQDETNVPLPKHQDKQSVQPSMPNL